MADLRSKIGVKIVDSTTNTESVVSAAGLLVDTELAAAAALADAASNPTTPTVGAANLVYNGATWDRARGDTANGIDVDVTRVTGTVTVDTELPTAAALADATANPTIPLVGAALEGFNGATWDRLRSTTANGLAVDVTRVSGTVTVDTELPTAAALADATANPTVPTVGGALLGYNGSTWDRLRTANTGRLQVDVITGGGASTPTAPKVVRATSSAVAAGSTATLTCTTISSGKTGKLAELVLTASVAIKADLQTVLNGTGTTVATFFVQANSTLVFTTPHLNYITQAESVTAGFDGFQVIITNNDTANAADVYATFLYDEV